MRERQGRSSERGHREEMPEYAIPTKKFFQVKSEFACKRRESMIYFFDQPKVGSWDQGDPLPLSWLPVILAGQHSQSRSTRTETSLLPRPSEGKHTTRPQDATKCWQRSILSQCSQRRETNRRWQQAYKSQLNIGAQPHFCTGCCRFSPHTHETTETCPEDS